MSGPKDIKIPFTVGDRDLLTKINTNLGNLVTNTERRLTEAERNTTALHGRISKAREDFVNRDRDTNKRIDKIRLISAIAGAALLIGGILGAAL